MDNSRSINVFFTISVAINVQYLFIGISIRNIGSHNQLLFTAGLLLLEIMINLRSKRKKPGNYQVYFNGRFYHKYHKEKLIKLQNENTVYDSVFPENTEIEFSTDNYSSSDDDEQEEETEEDTKLKQKILNITGIKVDSKQLQNHFMRHLELVSKRKKYAWFGFNTEDDKFSVYFTKSY